jgi:hypothetical protein
MRREVRVIITLDIDDDKAAELNGFAGYAALDGSYVEQPMTGLERSAELLSMTVGSLAVDLWRTGCDLDAFLVTAVAVISEPHQDDTDF